VSAARARIARAVAIAALASFLGSCAPHVVRPPELSLETREARYGQTLAARERAAIAVEADVVAWAVLEGDRDLPGAQARLLLASPDAFRLRVQTLLGTALDLGGRGDSLTAYVPARRAGIQVANAGDSLGLREPARFVVRSLGALWRPPAEAWASATWRDSLLEARWQEGEDSLLVTVGSSGHPQAATIARDGRGVRVRYEGWQGDRGAEWPARLTIEDLQGRGHVTFVVKNLRFAGTPDWSRLAVRIPRDATRVTLTELRHAFEELSAF
jgi:hypothetical protein